MKGVIEGGIDMGWIGESGVGKDKKRTGGGGRKREKGWRCPKIGEVKSREWRCERESRHGRCVEHHESEIL